jgi:uncharacterized Zn-finger protein
MATSAARLIKMTETTHTSQDIVMCDGGPFDGHPRIYLELGKVGKAVCPYCSHTFLRS